ncbi:hypothetical protein ANCCAN_28751 [Ancylostoma caninum]|uniref:Uncharacterized protein n=1 Tax=Ancylostoma caninum TaxID=29170 RepID=A0A368F0D6_ANCCA|nr:hypothetical protein ANCCAN_28751 [Ancylostoma caninum]
MAFQQPAYYSDLRSVHNSACMAFIVYICDLSMDEELKAKERSRRVAQHLRLVDRRDCVPVIVHVPGDPDEGG